MDGAYIEDSDILYDEKATKTVYTLTSIVTDKVESIIARNVQKRACINKLISTHSIRKIPYHIYFMSSNLDHILHNRTNLTDKDKIILVKRFSDRYSNNTEAFLEFINSPVIRQLMTIQSHGTT